MRSLDYWSAAQESRLSENYYTLLSCQMCMFIHLHMSNHGSPVRSSRGALLAHCVLQVNWHCFLCGSCYGDISAQHFHTIILLNLNGLRNQNTLLVPCLQSNNVQSAYRYCRINLNRERCAFLKYKNSTIIIKNKQT